MKLFRIAIYLLLVMGLLASCSLNRRPDWATMQSRDPAFYSSVVSVSTALPNYRDFAREQAMRGISSQISVQIDSELRVREQENAGYIFNDLAGTIRSRSSTYLEDVELHRSAIAGKYFYAEYRMNKARYRELRESRKRIAMQGALEALEAFDQSRGDVVTASYALIDAIESLEAFADLDLSAQYQSERVNLYTIALSRLKALPQKISLNWEQSSIRMVALVLEGRNINASAFYQKSSMESFACSNLPIKASFSRGSGSLLYPDLTDNYGKAAIFIKRIDGPEANQAILLDVDKAVFTDRTESVSLKRTIHALVFPSATLGIEVSRPGFALEIRSEARDQATISNQVRGKLLEWGLQSRQTNPDFLISISLEAVEGDYIRALNAHSANASLHLEILDGNGVSLSSNTYGNIKGTGNNRDTAHQRAIQLAIGNLCDQYLYQALRPVLFEP